MRNEFKAGARHGCGRGHSAGRKGGRARKMAALAAMAREYAGIGGDDDEGFGPGSGRGFRGGFGEGQSGRGRGRGLGGGPGGRGPGARGRGAGGEQGGRRGRRGMIGREELRLLLLKLIGDAPSHGYDLIKGVEGLTGGEYAPSPGVVYPTLQYLQDEGLISEMPDDSSRKIFSITDAGREELAGQEKLVEKLVSRLAALGEQGNSSAHRQLHRSMENLRNALRLHHGAGTLDNAMAEKIVDLIDETARNIERL